MDQSRPTADVSFHSTVPYTRYVCFSPPLFSVAPLPYHFSTPSLPMFSMPHSRPRGTHVVDVMQEADLVRPLHILVVGTLHTWCFN